MRRILWLLAAAAFCGAVLPLGAAAQSASSASSSSAGSQSQVPAPSAQGQKTPAPAPSDAKTSKKVWTNEDLGGLNGPVSVVGNSKNSGKTSGATMANPQYIANTRKELQKLRSQIDDANKEIADLQNFLAGKTPTSSGYPINKGYGRIPPDQQIASLEAKKKDLQEKIDALLDEARKKGVQPGDLR